MAKPATKEGRGRCPNCGESVTFKRSSGGKLTFACDADGCDSSGYAEPGGGTERKWLSTIKRPAAAPAAPDAGPAAQPAQPGAKPANSVFSLGAL